MKRVLLTGNDGYIGCILSKLLLSRGFHVTGVDSCFFSECAIGDSPVIHKMIRGDIRDLCTEDLIGFDAVLHFAALSNDPLGDLDPALTEEINFKASVQLAKLAKDAGVPRFIFSSSCSVYGGGHDELVNENSPVNPLTPYALSKIRSEEAIEKIASPSFTPVFMRNATAYGFSPRLRTDLVVNNLVAWALTTGEIKLMSDGMAWRPLAHVLDLAEAAIALIDAPNAAVGGQIFNVGKDGENYLVKEIAELVRERIPQCRISLSSNPAADTRSYRVDFRKLKLILPSLELTQTVSAGILELLHSLSGRFTRTDFEIGKFTRLATLKALIERGVLSPYLRWVGPFHKL